MQRVHGIVMFVVGTLVAQAGFVSNYPITINCTDDLVSPKSTMVVKVNLFENEATLSYNSDALEQPLFFSIGKVFGIHSSSSVNVARQTGGMGHDSTLTISAHSYQVFRVTHFANFSLTLDEKTDGVFEAQLLTYDAGIDAFPDTHEKGSITFDNLACVIAGL